MDADSFAHLHVHTEFSMLDGAARVDQLVAAVAADDQPAVAITDHGTLYGVIDFYKAATAAGVKPIVGIEAYTTPGSRFERLPKRENRIHHMTLLAVSPVGYRNLIQLSSRAFLEGYYYKPRMDVELLAEYSEGIVATSGCLGGQVAQLLAPDVSVEEGNQPTRQRDFEGAVAAAAMYQDIFGADNFFIEIMDAGVPAQQKVLPDLLAISRRIGAPLLATNDTHYTYAAEADAHDALLCIQTGALQSDEKRFRFESQEYYVKSARQMRELFPADEFPAACDNTLLVAERAETALELGRLLLPQFPVPEGDTERSYLRRLVTEGARRRYPELSEEVTRRIDYELGVIDDMGFNAYFLIVWDLIRHATEQGFRTGPGRGSAAGSIVAYCLGITKLDPIEYGLIFERFLNPGRRTMPDIDMDFDERHRGEMIAYCAERYGSDHVAQIVTFSTIKGRQALRDSARVLGHPYGVGDRIAKAMPQAILGKEATLAQCLEEPEPGASQEVRDWYAGAAALRTEYHNDPAAREIIDTARGLEGLRRQDSIHAAAVVISPVPLTEIVPLQRKGDDAEIVTQYEMHGVEDLGLLKMDFLGLRNLTTIERAIELIERNTGERVDIDRLPLDDEKVYAMLREGDSMGVFQFEGGPMRALMRRLGPDRFEHLVALNALYRPGPLGAGMHNEYAERKNGRSPVELLHPDMGEVLADTYGIMVYQEQVMQVAQHMAGYSMEAADNLRKAMGKKIAQVMADERDKFVAGCVANGYTEKLGKDLFGFIEHFAGYGFNRSHSAAYALVAYQTAWLKAHYPAEYMAALLTASKRDKDRTAIYLNECRSMDLQVLVPDINRSESDFAAVDGAITFGLSAVRNVGEGVVELITAERGAGGPFTGIEDFLNRVDPSVLNKRTVESLVKAGAFDSLGHPRKGLLVALLGAGDSGGAGMLDATVARRRAEDMGQYSLFGGAESVIEEAPLQVPDTEWDRRVKLDLEKEMLGLYVSDHPLFSVGRALERICTTSIGELWDAEDGSRHTIGGIVSNVQRRFNQKQQMFHFFRLEGLEAGIEVAAFPRVTEHYGHLIREDAVLAVTGRLDHRGDDIKFIAAELAEPATDDDGTVRIQAAATMLSRNLVSRLKDTLSQHPGTAPVYLHMTNGAGEPPKVIKLGDDLRVEPRSSLYAELRMLLGAAAII